MIAWRISKVRHAADLSGMGAALEGGRWNQPDVAAVYMGLSPAICTLETFVHAASQPPVPLKITRFILPSDLELYWTPNPNDLPQGWRLIPADTPSMEYGTKWLNANTHLGLIVPSVVLPLESNIVINPSHPAITQIKIDEQYDFLYDERMFSA